MSDLIGTPQMMHDALYAVSPAYRHAMDDMREDAAERAAHEAESVPAEPVTEPMTNLGSVTEPFVVGQR